MDIDGNFPLDISEFRCTSVDRAAVVVVFEQTNRRYTYTWTDGELDLSEPVIVGRAEPHVPEVIDCLARAVAYKAARDATVRSISNSHRTPAAVLRSWLSRHEGRRTA